MTVERTQNEVIVHLSAAINVEELQRILNYLTYKDATASSEATQEEVDQISSEFNRGRWSASGKKVVK
ncbi:hypothetical protein [Fibrella arboris]|uniref:hypothetical protein n=1 Tax=Fibrella arboris TaxID=3242486 RepID=UPI003522E3B0